jgi:NADP-dependent 3-hydroxy acid dehydrogenase YdfG
VTNSTGGAARRSDHQPALRRWAARKPVAVVTDASNGIGAATARQLAADGFTVIIGARREDRIKSLTAEIGTAIR